MIGVWEDEKFIGVVLFGNGAGQATNGKKYGLERRGEVAELARVALTDHKAPVSRIISIAIKMMKKRNTGIRLVISFADEKEQGHIGGIYQAGNWIYTGLFTGKSSKIIFGKIVHGKTLQNKKTKDGRRFQSSIHWIRKNVDPNAEEYQSKKHRYLMPLDDEVKKTVIKFKKPYPKRVKQAMTDYPSEQRQGSTDLHAPNS